MKRNFRVVVAVAVLALAHAGTLHSQTATAKPAQIGIMGGATFPLGSDFSDLTSRGWNAGALISLGAPAFPLSFRLEGQWHQLAGNTTSIPDRGNQSTDLRIIDGTADFEYAFGKLPSSNFYVIGGLGLYNLRGRNSITPGFIRGGTDSTFTLSANKFGWNAGFGIRAQLAGYTLFVESRYHAVSNGHSVDVSGSSKAIHFIPIDIGITL